MSISLKVNDINVTVKKGSTILDAANKAGVYIPTLCFLKNVNEPTGCRMCIVDTGGGKLSPACKTPAWDGMEVNTDTVKIREIRKTIIELTLANHNTDCTSCVRNLDCKLQEIANMYLIEDENNLFEKEYDTKIDDVPVAVNRDFSKCVKCGKCVKVCEKMQQVKALSYNNRSKDTVMSAPFEHSLKDSNCISCGQCIVHCPVGALYEKGTLEDIYEDIGDKYYYNIMMVSDQSYHGIGKAMKVDDTLARNKLVPVMKEVGFDMVVDYEAYLVSEINYISNILRETMANEKTLLYACSPGIYKKLIKDVPDSEELFVNLSKVREDLNTQFKENFLPKDVDKDVHLTRVENCTALLEEKDNGIDITMTTRQLAELANSSLIDFSTIKGSGFDELEEFSGEVSPFYMSIQTAYDIYRLGDDDVVENRIGMKKEYSFKVNDNQSIKCAVVWGYKAALIETKKVLAGKSEYDFVCMTSCMEGCKNGGGRAPIY